MLNIPFDITLWMATMRFNCFARRIAKILCITYTRQPTVAELNEAKEKRSR